MTDPPMTSIKVLLIEDDERLAQLTARYLESHGVQVTIAITGTDGQAEALRRQYDCVVLDVMLPGRDGIEVTRELRARTDVPIVMVTARTEEADRVLGLEVGADDYVTKPFSPRELLARIRATDALPSIRCSVASTTAARSTSQQYGSLGDTRAIPAGSSAGGIHAAIW